MIFFLSYKLEFEATNNVVEYEALALGLEVSRKISITQLEVCGYYEPVVQQVRNVYQTKHSRMRSYINLIWDLIGNFFLSFNITSVSRELNQQEDSLVVNDSTFKVLAIPKTKYKVEMRYRPSILDNVKH